MASQQEIKELQQRLRERMTPMDLREAEYAMLAEVESKCGFQFHPEDRCAVTIMVCCWIAGLHPIEVTSGDETTRLASLFKAFWLRVGRSPGPGEARALVRMVNAELLNESKLITSQHIH